jgi:hypothetical protein
MRQLDGHQAGRIQQTPERISGTGKVMANRLRAQARIDTDEQNPRPWYEDIAKRHAIS